MRALGASLLLAAASLGAIAAHAQSPGVPAAGAEGVGLEWQLGQTRRGLPTVWGYVHNLHGVPLANVRLSITPIEADGRSGSETVGYVDGVIPPKGYAYFEVRVPRAAAAYRATVRHYDLVVGAGGSP